MKDAYVRGSLTIEEFGFSPHEPSHRSSLRRVRTSLVALLTGLALTASSGCSAVSQLSGPDYKGTDLANDVVTAINRNAKQYGLGRKVGATSADCEDVETVEKDAIADCTVTGKDGKDYYVRVTFQDSKGHFVVNAA